MMKNKKIKTNNKKNQISFITKLIIITLQTYNIIKMTIKKINVLYVM